MNPNDEYPFLDGLFEDGLFGEPIAPAAVPVDGIKAQVETLLTDFMPHLQEVVSSQIRVCIPLVTDAVNAELARLQAAQQYFASLQQQGEAHVQRLHQQGEAHAERMRADMDAFVSDINGGIRQVRRDVATALEEHIVRLDHRQETLQAQDSAEWRAALAAHAAAHRDALAAQAAAHHAEMQALHAETRALIDTVMRFAAQSEEARR